MTGILQALLMGRGAAAAATDADFEYVTLLLPGNGTNGAQNNTFLDSSTNNFTITRNGNTTQGTFSPYGSNWSNYFDGTGDYLSVADNTALTLTANFTIECWIYPTAGAADRLIISKWGGTAEYYIFTQTNNVIGFAWGPYNPSGLFGGALLLSGNNAFALNTWSHVAVVRNSNTFTLYVNGTSVATATNSAAVTDGPEPVTIGDYNGGGYGFAGYISNARIVKGTAVYTAAFTPPTAPLTAITNTSLLTCQSSRFIDNSTNAFAITVNGNTSVQRFSPFSPTAAYASGTIGGSGYFDGTGDWLRNSSDITLDADFCLEAYLYITSLSGTKILFSSISSTPGTNVQIPRIQTNGGVYVYINGTELNAGSTATDLGTLNQWNHFAMTRSGSTVRAFVNGVQIWSTTYSSSFGVGVVGQFYLSGSPYGGGYDYAGYMASVRVVKGSAVYTSNFTPPTVPLTAITNTQLLLNMTNAGIIDNAMMNDLETVGNAQISTSVSKFGGGSMSFDGTGDYLVSNPATTDLYAFGGGNFTIEMWIRFNAVNTIQVVYDSRPTSQGNYPMIYLNSDGTIRYYVNSADRITSSAISSGVWYHLAIARSGTSTKMFIDGTQAGSTYTDSTSYLNGSGRPWVGFNAFNSNPDQALNAYIDDLRVTKGVARYTANFTAPTAAFPTS